MPRRAVLLVFFYLRAARFLSRLKAHVGHCDLAAAVGAGRSCRQTVEHIAHIGVVDEREFVIANGAFLAENERAFFFILDRAHFEEQALRELFAFSAIEYRVESDKPLGGLRVRPQRHALVESVYLFGSILAVNRFYVVRLEQIDCLPSHVVIDHGQTVGVVHHERGALRFVLIEQHAIDRFEQFIRVAFGDVVHSVLQSRNVARPDSKHVVFAAFIAFESNGFSHQRASCYVILDRIIYRNNT